MGDVSGGSVQAGFAQLARYNRWANARLYEAALALPEERYRADVGVFFRSLHGTLNHVLVGDRIWLRRLTGEGELPRRLDEILFDDRRELARARAAEDERIIAVVGVWDDAALAGSFSYRTMDGQPHEQPLADVLRHVFNHQTHHRGQAHACLSILGAPPPPLDVLYFLRGLPAPDLTTSAEPPAPATR